MNSARALNALRSIGCRDEWQLDGAEDLGDGCLEWNFCWKSSGMVSSSFDTFRLWIFDFAIRQDGWRFVGVGQLEREQTGIGGLIFIEWEIGAGPESIKLVLYFINIRGVLNNT